MTGPKVETENQNQNQPNQNPNPNPSESNNSGTPTSEIPPQAIETVPREEMNRTLESTHGLYRQALTEGETQRRELQRRLDEAEARNRTPVQQIPDDQLSPQQLIERSVRQSVAPLLDEFSIFRQQQQANTYQTIKTQFRNLPQFAPFFNQLEPHIDAEMQGKPISVESVQNAIATVIGRIQMQAALNPQPINQTSVPNNQQQQYQQPQNPPQQPQNNRQQSLPPHLRPSAPPLPNRSGDQNLTPGGNQRFQLTQLQERVARENKLTHDQYIDWITETPENVVHSQIGVAKP